MRENKFREMSVLEMDRTNGGGPLTIIGAVVATAAGVSAIYGGIRQVVYDAGKAAAHREMNN
jgi:hypothetical protein